MFRTLLADGRLLTISPVLQFIRRVDAALPPPCVHNRYILDHADKFFLGSLDPDGSLKELMELPPHLYKCDGSVVCVT